MRRAALLAAAAALLAGCAHNRLAPGPYKEGYAVEVAAPSTAMARQDAVALFFDLYVSSPAAVQATLDEKILKKPEAFIAREKTRQEGGRAVLRALVDYQKLGRALDSAGLVRPDGVKGKPRVLIALRESGPGAGPGPAGGGGRAAETLRRRLIERGYAAIDDSDGLNGGAQKSGSREEALAHAKKNGAEVLVTGEARAQAVADPRLAGYGNCRAVVSAQALKLPAEAPAGAVEAEASSVDVSEVAAGAKALESAGEIAADRVAAALGQQYQERAEFTVTVINLGNLDRTRQLLQAMRRLPKVAAAAFDAAAGSDVRVKLWADKMGADDMTAELLKLKDFKLEVREVDPSFNAIELGTGEAY